MQIRVVSACHNTAAHTILAPGINITAGMLCSSWNSRQAACPGDSLGKVDLPGIHAPQSLSFASSSWCCRTSRTHQHMCRPGACSGPLRTHTTCSYKVVFFRPCVGQLAAALYTRRNCQKHREIAQLTFAGDHSGRWAAEDTTRRPIVARTSVSGMSCRRKAL